MRAAPPDARDAPAMLDRSAKSLDVGADAASKRSHYQEIIQDIKRVLHDETDWVAVMATVSSMLHHAFCYYHWTGFYSTVKRQPRDFTHHPAAAAAAAEAAASGSAAAEPEQQLVVGPYQGTLGCLRIPYSRGVCGAAARSRATQLVPDVHGFPGHIACASSTCSELVVPVTTPDGGACVAVLDVDSDIPAAFDGVDQQQLEQLCSWLGSKHAECCAA